jgi:hypothetical protein
MHRNLHENDVPVGRENAVHRNQVYLSDEEMRALRSIARRLGTTQSDVIRIAVDRFIALEEAEDRAALLHSGRALWKKRRDLPDFTGLRQEVDRSGGLSGDLR